MRFTFLPSLERKDALPGKGSSVAERVQTPVGMPGQPYKIGWNVARAVKDGYERDLWVYKCVHQISTDESRLPVELVDDDPDSNTRTDGDDIAKLLNGWANPQETGKQFRYRLGSQLLLSKKGVFVELIRSNGGKLIEFHLLPPDMTSPIPDPEEFIAGWLVEAGQHRYELPPERVLWIRRPHPTDAYSGNTPMEAAGLSIDTDFYARLYNRNFLQNDGRPATVIGIKGKVDANELKEIERRYQGGVSQAGRLSVVDGIENMTISDLARSPRDMQYKDLRIGTKEEILLAFGCPESVLGNASGRTFDNADAEAVNYWNVTMRDHNETILDAFSALRYRGGTDDNLHFAHNVENVEPLQRLKRAEREQDRQDYEAGLMTIDEYREKWGHDPIGEKATETLWIPNTKKAITGEAAAEAEKAGEVLGEPSLRGAPGGSANIAGAPGAAAIQGQGAAPKPAAVGAGAGPPALPAAATKPAAALATGNKVLMPGAEQWGYHEIVATTPYDVDGRSVVGVTFKGEVTDGREETFFYPSHLAFTVEAKSLAIDALEVKFREDQDRDQSGRWTAGGAGLVAGASVGLLQHGSVTATYHKQGKVTTSAPKTGASTDRSSSVGWIQVHDDVTTPDGDRGGVHEIREHSNGTWTVCVDGKENGRNYWRPDDLTVNNDLPGSNWPPPSNLYGKFDPGQERDDTGKWTAGGGNGSVAKMTSGDVGKLFKRGDVTLKAGPASINSVATVLDKLSQGKDVWIKPTDVNTFLDVLAARAQSGKTFDLANVSVGGNEIFKGEGPARSEMPQIPNDARAEFLSKMAEEGIKAKDAEVAASSLRPTQREIDGGKVVGMMNAVEKGKLDLNDTRIIVSKDGYVLDGHHRWAAAVGLDYQDGKPGDVKIPVTVIDTTMKDLLPRANEFVDEAGITRVGINEGTGTRKKSLDYPWLFYREPDFTTMEEKGDTAGHPFRGNQWTGGIGETFGTADPVLAAGKAEYLAKNGLAPERPIDFNHIYRQEGVWQRVGAAMKDAPIKDTSPETVRAYEAMRTQTAQQWDLLTEPKSEGGLGIRVDVSKDDPYPEPGRVGFDKMMADLKDGHMGVLETHGHPFFTDEEYTRFRAVHDAFGHGAIGRGFDRHSEEAAWVSHSQMFTGEAQRALTTETRGQNSYLGLTHEFSSYKMALLPNEYSNPLPPVVAGEERASILKAKGDDPAMMTTWDDEDAHICAVSGHVNVPTGNTPPGRKGAAKPTSYRPLLSTKA